MKNPIIPGILIVQFLLLGIILSLGADAQHQQEMYDSTYQAVQRDVQNESPKGKPHHIKPQDMTKLLAQELGLDLAQFDEVFRNLDHPNPSMTREQARAITGKNRQVIAKAFGLDEDKVAQAMHKFRPGAPMMPPPPGVDGACDSDHGRPVEAVARELGVTPQQFREAFKNVMPAPRGEEPTDEQRLRNRQVLAKALGVDPEKLDAVMDKYRPEGPNQRPPRPAPPAEKQGDAPSESGY